jgi:four helix bundle protein
MLWVVGCVLWVVGCELLEITNMETSKVKSYKDLDIYNLSFDTAVKIYSKTLELPNHDKFEAGSQIRRSSQGIKDAIVEGYGRRKYKNDFIKFLVYSHASSLEALSQAEFLHEVHPDSGWDMIAKDLDIIGSKIQNFIKYVENNWRT